MRSSLALPASSLDSRSDLFLPHVHAEDFFGPLFHASFVASALLGGVLFPLLAAMSASWVLLGFALVSAFSTVLFALLSGWVSARGPSGWMVRFVLRRTVASRGGWGLLPAPVLVSPLAWSSGLASYAALSPAALEVALVLLADGFDGSLGELLDASRLLS